MRTKKAAKMPVQVNQQRVADDSKGWLTSKSAIALMGVMIVFMAGGLWLGLQLIIDPNAIALINRFLPKHSQLPVPILRDNYQTLPEIQAEIRKKGLIPGEPLELKTDESSASVLLLPLQESPVGCKTECDRIVELRAYKPNDEGKYKLSSNITVAGPEESFVLTTFETEEPQEAQSSRILPLTQITRFEVDAPGIWLNVSGELEWNNTPLAYGQIVHYNPNNETLALMPLWTSPAENPPYWQNVSGEDLPELVINQTLGLEPLFQVYQIKLRNFGLHPVDLEEIVLEPIDSDSIPYRQGLTLAQAGLWSQAWELLQSLNQTDLSPDIKAQIDLVGLHHQFIESEVKKTWVSPSQQALAYLVNGRWEEALQVFQSSVSPYRYEIATTVRGNSKRLWKRIEAALKVNPDRVEVKTWAALLLTVQQGRSQAISWLVKQPQNSLEVMSKVEEAIEQLEVAIADAETKQSHFSQIIGFAKPVAQINTADWLQPQQNPTNESSSLTLEPQQSWYQIQINGFNDGKTWQKSPFTNLKRPLVEPGNQLWRLLGLNTDSRIVLTAWNPEGNQQSIVASIKAIQLNNGVLQLLAAGEILPPANAAQFLAHTQTALQWFQPTSISLFDFYQQKPELASVLLPNLWRELESTNELALEDAASIALILDRIGHWSVQTLDLTGNQQAETIVTISPDGFTALKQGVQTVSTNSLTSKQRSLIFSDTGALLYSELTTHSQESFAAVADRGDGGLPLLVVRGSNQYNLKRWSAQTQQFQL